MDKRQSTTAIERRRIIGASMVGTTIEWFDFFIYGISASLVFGKLFFPSEKALIGTLLALATFAVGFAARPLGGLIFGHLGDHIGRKKLLLASLVLMGGSTMAIGVLPTYADIGLAAPVILILLRILQGIAVGGEWGGAVLLVAEHAPPAERGLWASWPQVGAPLGSVLASGALAALSSGLSNDAFFNWGWRIPFLFSVVLLVVGYWVRTKIEEPEVFKEFERKSEKSKVPVLDVIRDHKRPLLIALGGYFAINVLYYILLAFSLVYLVDAGGSRNVGLWAIAVASACQVVMLPLIGAWSDRVGRKTPYLIGSLGLIPFSFVMYPLLNMGGFIAVVVALILGLFLHSMMYAPQASLFCELFPTRVRYTAVSLGVQLPTIFAGGVAPIISTALLQYYGSWIPVAIYMGLSAALTSVAIFFSPETVARDLKADHPFKSRGGAKANATGV